MRIIIFDFEVFKFDTLLGAIIINENNGDEIFQSWNLNEISNFYENHKNDIWIGHNNSHYDNYILQTVYLTKNQTKVKNINDDIIKRNLKVKLSIKLYNYDLISNHFGSLKSIEAAVGKKISETKIDFDIDRPLYLEEKVLEEEYNRDDLYQTLDNFSSLFTEFQLRLEIIKEFNLPLESLSLTGTQIAEKVLGANRIDGIENEVISPKIHNNLILKNEKLIDYYLKEKFKTDEKLEIKICNVIHRVGSGGIHGAKEKIYCDKCLYLDVSGYYNLIMINFDLLPRSISKKGKDLYIYMYHEQLKLKGITELALKRQSYKVILLAVFGAMLNKYSKFYDPYKGDLVTITGQIYIVDLLEKLEGKIDLIQSNTDGIMVKPLPGHTDDEIIQIVDNWCKRTGFVIKPKTIYNVFQRDVNNYVYQDKEGNINAKGEALKHFECDDNPFITDLFNSKEPPIIAKGIVEYLINKKLPEKTIEENKEKLKYFQFICKKLSYDWIEYEKENGERKKLQDINRVFAMNDNFSKGMIYKYKIKDDKISKSRFASLPDSVFIFNEDIKNKEIFNEIYSKIDYNYYVKRIYERINEFLYIPQIKDVIL